MNKDEYIKKLKELYELAKERGDVWLLLRYWNGLKVYDTFHRSPGEAVGGVKYA